MKQICCVLCMMAFLPTLAFADSGGWYKYANRVVEGGLSVREASGHGFRIEINLVNTKNYATCEYKSYCSRHDLDKYICKHDDGNGFLRLSMDFDSITVRNEGSLSEYCGNGVSVDGKYTRFIPSNTDEEYSSFLNDHDDLKAADRKLNAVWKEVTKALSPSAKKELLSEQRYWIKRGREARVTYFLSQGETPASSFTKAVLERCDELRTMGRPAKKRERGESETRMSVSDRKRLQKLLDDYYNTLVVIEADTTGARLSERQMIDFAVFYIYNRNRELGCIESEGKAFISMAGVRNVLRDIFGYTLDMSKFTDHVYTWPYINGNLQMGVGDEGIRPEVQIKTIRRNAKGELEVQAFFDDVEEEGNNSQLAFRLREKEHDGMPVWQVLEFTQIP